MKKFIKLFLIVIVVILSGVIAIFIGAILLTGGGGAVPVDASHYQIKVLKSGVVDTLVVYTVHYEPGDTLYVYKEPGYNFRSDDEYTSKIVKKQKAIILPN